LSAGDARHGRRDNGLVAAEYAAAGDVDPRVGEHLLDVLALDGIAAYLRPSTDLHPVTRSSTLPGRPTDRLFVDRIHLSTARDYLARLAEEPDGSVSARGDGIRDDALRDQALFDQAMRDQGMRDDTLAAPRRAGETVPPADNIDDEWAKIVAGFDAEVPGRSWPEAEDLPANAATTPLFPERDDRPIDRAESVQPAEPSLLDGLDTFGASLPDPEEDGYDPPTPPPVPRPSAPTALAVAGIIIGLIVFLKPGLLPVGESVAMLVGFTAVVGGFATLVWRLRPGDDDDDIDPDQGAKV
jgi:hypothetical protein